MKWENSLMREFTWSGEMANRDAKLRVGEKIALQARDGDVIGIGSGSTVYMALEALAGRIGRGELQVKVIPGSFETMMACIRLGIPQVSLWERRPDWTFDGADEVDPAHNLIKGRGGAMFKEKILIACSPRVFIIVDNTKLVGRLGMNFPVPVEVFPAALPLVELEIRKLGATEIMLRPAKGKDGPVVTENGNLILDTRFQTIGPALEKELKEITGVVESGLFWGYRPEVVVAGG